MPSPTSRAEIVAIDVLEDHARACDGFSVVVRAASGRWDAPSPCSEWNARGVLEHVIGFHDVLLLRPLDAKPMRPKDDPVRRWEVTVDALFSALSADGAVDAQRETLLAVLTTDVLVHTWDLAKAIGIEPVLDLRLTEIGLERTLANRRRFESSDMFGPPVPVPEDAPVQDRLIAFFGRNPSWHS